MLDQSYWLEQVGTFKSEAAASGNVWTRIMGQGLEQVERAQNQ